MSRYAVDKALREVIMSLEASSAFVADASAFLDGRDLTTAERDALIALDYATLYAGGAHPFLLNVFAIGLWPRAEFLDRQRAYTQSLAGLGYPDFST
jgi:hypothetical protein